MTDLKQTIWAKIKTWAVVYGAFILLSGGVFAIASPHIRAYVVEVVQNDIEAKKPNNKSFREAFGEKIDVPADEVLNLFVEWYFETQDHEKLVDAIYPLLKEELETIQPRLIIYANKRAKWLADDGELYDTTRNEEGYRFYWKNGKWNPCIF